MELHIYINSYPCFIMNGVCGTIHIYVRDIFRLTFMCIRTLFDLHICLMQSCSHKFFQFTSWFTSGINYSASVIEFSQLGIVRLGIWSIAQSIQLDILMHLYTYNCCTTWKCKVSEIIVAIFIFISVVIHPQTVNMDILW